jgi:hypothetical protein
MEARPLLILPHGDCGITTDANNANLMKAFSFEDLHSKRRKIESVRVHRRAIAKEQTKVV